MAVHYRNNPTTLKMIGESMPDAIQLFTACTVGDTFDPSITLRGGCPYTPAWTFGDGTTGTGTSITKADYTNAGPHAVTLTIPNMAYWLTGIDVNDDKITGDFLAAISRCISLTSIIAHENLALVSDLSSLSRLTNLAYLKMGDRSGVYGDLSSLIGLHNLTSLTLSGTKVVSSIAPLATMTQLTHLDLHSNVAGSSYGDITGDLSSLSGLVNLNLLSVGQTRVVGEMADLVGMTNLGALLAYNTATVPPGNFAGKISDGPDNIAYLYITGSQVTGDVMGPDHAEYILIGDLGWNQATVDAFLADLYTNRVSYTGISYGATHVLQIHGTNAAPSGIYQDVVVPSTGLEYVYKLANDPDGEGFIKWSITYTGGTAP